MKTELDRFQQDGDNATARHLILLATFRLVIAVFGSEFLLALLGIELGAGRFKAERGRCLEPAAFC